MIPSRTLRKGGTKNIAGVHAFPRAGGPGGMIPPGRRRHLPPLLQTSTGRKVMNATLDVDQPVTGVTFAAAGTDGRCSPCFLTLD